MWQPDIGDPEWAALVRLSEDNLRMLEVCSDFLNWTPCAVTPEAVRSLSEDCRLPLEQSYRVMMAAYCGLNGEESPQDRRLENQYFPYAVHRFDPASCLDDPYRRLIRMPEKTCGMWRIGTKRLEAYEAFVSDDLLELDDGREVPQIGWFENAFEAPAVYQNGREWMTVTPSEQNTMLHDVAPISGRVAVFGLGLGYYALLASEKPEVEHVTVVELDPDIIDLFTRELLPQFPHRDKIGLVCGDAFEFAEKMPPDAYDYAYVDIWHDVSDGVPMYLRMKVLEEKQPHTRFLYWIERSMLCWLRGMAIQEAQDGGDTPLLNALGKPCSIRSLRALLTDDALKKAAHAIPLDAITRH